MEFLGEERSPRFYVVDRVGKGRADQLMEPLPGQVEHPRHLGHGDRSLGFFVEVVSHWTYSRHKFDADWTALATGVPILEMLAAALAVC